MKRQALLLWLLLPFAWLSAQTATISGTVTDTSGIGQGNLAFTVFAFDSSSTVFTQVITDPAGSYSVQIPVSNPVTGTPVFFLYDNCIDPGFTDSLGFITNNITYNFTACGSGGGFCNATFSAIPQGPSSLTVDFSPTVQGYTSYDWIFGDGNSSNQVSPTHTYANPGTYTVLLAIVDNVTGCVDTSDQTIIVPGTGGGGNCIAIFTSSNNGRRSFTFSPFLPIPGLNYNWSFGDGNSSNAMTPTHVYAADSTYDVCLIISDPVSGCSDSVCIPLTVGTPPPPCNISFFPFQSPSNGQQVTFYPSDTNFVS
jgi:PKD repeat protein